MDAPPKLQYGALPYRRHAGALEIMLVTSRQMRRWIIPKGWPVAGLAPHESAAHEAMEEAGLLGEISARSLGSYRYTKRLVAGSITCQVDVFPLRTREQLPAWPEMHQRSTQWFTLEDAAAAVDEPELSEMIRKFAGA
jgi:8-oxo-dGTP pyrophosphatase MutT (NUDIX family)